MKKITCLPIITIAITITFASLSSDEPSADSKNQDYTSPNPDRNTMQTDQNENNRDDSFRLGEKEQLSSSTTVTYSIPEWGLYNESYTIESNTAINAQTGKKYCYFKFTNENGEITPDSIDKPIHSINDGKSK